MWDDSNCTVEQKYISSPKIKSLNNTSQFKNSLAENKGDISSARIFHPKGSIFMNQDSPKRNLVSSSGFSEDGKAISLFTHPKEDQFINIMTKAKRAKSSEGNSLMMKKPKWGDLCKKKQLVESPKLLSSMR